MCLWWWCKWTSNYCTLHELHFDYEHATLTSLFTPRSFNGKSLNRGVLLHCNKNHSLLPLLNNTPLMIFVKLTGSNQVGTLSKKNTLAFPGTVIFKKKILSKVLFVNVTMSFLSIWSIANLCVPHCSCHSYSCYLTKYNSEEGTDLISFVLNKMSFEVLKWKPKWLR